MANTEDRKVMNLADMYSMCSYVVNIAYTGRQVVNMVYTGRTVMNVAATDEQVWGGYTCTLVHLYTCTSKS